jgi:hypothetical protein
MGHICHWLQAKRTKWASNGQRAFDVWLDPNGQKTDIFYARLRHPTGDALIPCIALKILVSITSVYFLE